MDEREETGREPEPAELTALTALTALTLRVSELERMVGALMQSQAAAGPVRRSAGTLPPAPVRAAAAPPPPVPAGGAPEPGLPRIAAAPSETEDGVPLISPLAAALRLPRGLPQFRPAPAAEGKSLENRLGAQVFNLVGILALVISAAYGLKLAIEHGYLGPVARVLIGIAAGVGVVLWSERLRRKQMVAFSYSLKAVGSAVLYLSLWAAFQLYHLLPAPVALGAMILVTAWNAFMAWSQDSELLAAYALAGAFLTPLLLSTGGDHEAFLLTYVGAIDLAMVVLMRTKPWWRLLLPTFVLSALYYFGWYSSHYTYVDGVGPLKETIAFVLAFFAIYAALSVRGWMRDGGPAASAAAKNDQVVVPVLVPLLNAAFTGFALFSILQDSGLHSLRPWLMVALAALYLGLMRVQRSSVARAMHLAIGVVFLTVAIPLKASGHSLTTAWLVEGLVLLWASTRFEKEERQASRVLWVLSAGGYALGLGSLVAHWFVGSIFGMDGFFNRDLGAAAVAVLTLGGAVWLAVRERDKGRDMDGLAVAGMVALGGVAALLCLRQVGLTADGGTYAGFANASFGTALVGLAVFAGAAYASLRLKTTGMTGIGGLAVAGLVAIDGVGVLFCLRELASTWTDEGHRAFANPAFATALVGLAVLAGVAYVAWRLRVQAQPRMEALAGATVIAFNLLTILTVEREIGALWHRGDANLQRSLAISGFLMAYGSGLLAVGFVKRTAFIRWQALALLLFTICKVFLYDISGLSAGYRVASFMGLGAVLMGISYAYQKDWLGLKEPLAGATQLADPPADPSPDSLADSSSGLGPAPIAGKDGAA